MDFSTIETHICPKQIEVVIGRKKALIDDYSNVWVFSIRRCSECLRKKIKRLHIETSYGYHEIILSEDIQENCVEIKEALRSILSSLVFWAVPCELHCSEQWLYDLLLSMREFRYLRQQQKIKLLE